MSKSILMDMEPLVIRPAVESDAQGIAEIYNPFILDITVTFEEEPVTVEAMLMRMEKARSQSFPWLCAERGGILAGYAYASKWRERSAYRFVAETTIYLTPGYTNRGIGKRLYGTLIDQLKQAGMHALMGVITLPNPASVALHEKLGFVKVAHFSEVGYKFNHWLDVGYWQRLL